MDTYTFSSPVVTDLIVGQDDWDYTDLCEAVTNTIRFVMGGLVDVTIDPPEDDDFVTVTAPRRFSPDEVEEMVRNAVAANMAADEDDEFNGAVPNFGLTLRTAITLVWADRQAGSREPLTLADAVTDARDVISLPERGHVIGAHPLNEDGTPTAAAYRMVLSADRRELDAALAQGGHVQG